MVPSPKAVFSPCVLPQAQKSFFIKSLARGNKALCSLGLRFLNLWPNFLATCI